MLIKKEYHSPETCLSQLDELVTVFLTKINLQYFVYLGVFRCCLLHAKVFAKIFFKSSNLDESGICSPAFPSRIYMRLHNIPVTLDLVKKVTIDLDSSKVTRPGCILVVVVKNCEPELSDVLAHHDHGPGKS